MKTGEHSDIKAFGKDIWAQRKIYAPIIVHFYNSATDIGVVYYRSTLWQNEKNGIYDYESVDMEIFFWCGIAFLALYRVMLFGFLLIMVIKGDSYVEWFDPILVPLEMYVFRTVYLSYNDAQKVIKKNVMIRQQRKQFVTPTGSAAGSSSTNATPTTTKLPEEGKIEVNLIQYLCLMAESVTESLPQIMLQSVFIIRSYNDPKLRDGNIWLLLISVFASLLSITDKFVTIDEDQVNFGKGAKFSAISKGVCLNKDTLWYAVRVIWRLSHITSNFCIYVLVWTVMGGAFLPMWCTAVTMLYTCLLCLCGGGDDCIEVLVASIINMGGVILSKDAEPMHYVKWRVTVSGLMLIAAFAMTTFDCGICADSAERSFYNEDETGVRNYRILIFYGVGWGALLMEIVLFKIMLKMGMLTGI